MKFKLDEKYCKNFEKGISTEWLETNKLGAYSSSTIYGLNNRKEHGLFVVPTSNIKLKTNLLSKFEETVFVQDFSFELSSNQYEKSVYPDGFKYLVGFNLNPFPVFQYKISDRRLDKSILLLHDKNVLIVRYELKNNGDPVKLIIKPIIAARFANDLVKDIQGINPDSYLAENVVKIAPRSDLPEINISYHKGDYTPAALWYHNFYYNINANSKSKLNKEDLLNPGFFTYTLNPYESFEIYVSTDEWFDYDYEYLYRKELIYRQNINKKFISLPQFMQDISKKMEMIPTVDLNNLFCFPEYFNPLCNPRDTITAMNDYMMIQDDEDKIKKFIESVIPRINNGLLLNEESDTENFVYCDTSLQFINLCYYYYRLYKNLKFLEDTLFDPLNDIIDNFRKGTDFNIYMDKDNLIFSGDKNTSTGLIRSDSKQVFRYGKLLEINLFWLNALYIMRFFSKEIKKPRLEKKFTKLIEKASESFLDKFWDQNNQRLFDFIRNDFSDDTFRFIQIYTLSLPFQILEKEKGKILLHSIKNELLTKYGLRSLSLKDKNYLGTLPNRNDDFLDKSYQGAIIPATIGDYIIGCVNYGELKTEELVLSKILENFLLLTQQNCLGYFSEYLEGDEPFKEFGRTASISNMLAFLKAAIYFYKSTDNE